MIANSTVILGIGGLALLASTALIARAFLAGSAAGKRAQQACLGTMIVLTFLVLVTLFIGVFKGQYSDWDAARLGAAVAAFRGESVYRTLTEGSVQTTMYPPAWLLSYGPSAIAKTPTQVMMIGYFMALLFSIGPLGLACWRFAASPAHALIGLALFLYATTQVLTLQFSCFLPHSDAPALGYALLAAYTAALSLRRDGKKANRLLLIATPLWMAMSIYSKQTMLPIVPAIAGWIWCVHSRKSAILLCVVTGVIGVLALALCSIIFSFEGMFFNLVTLPANCPWVGQFPFNLVSTFLELAEICVPPLLALLVVGILRKGSTPARTAPAAKPELWPLLLIIAIALVPFSVLGRVKSGGIESALAPTVYFMFAAMSLMLVESVKHLLQHSDSSKQRSALHALMLAVALCVSCPWYLKQMQDVRYGFRAPQDNLSQQAYDFLIAHPDTQIYFPAYPLAHLMAEHKLYHFMLAIRDREVEAGVPLSPEQFQAHVPPAPEYVAWSKRLYKTERQIMPGYYAEYVKPQRMDSLPDFRCFSPSP